MITDTAYKQVMKYANKLSCINGIRKCNPTASLLMIYCVLF